MKTKILVAIGLAVMLLSFSAAASMLIPANENARNNARAPEKSPVISETPTGEWELERVDFIHYAKPSSAAKPLRTDTCYKLMGVTWPSLPVSYAINPSNPDGLTEEFVTSAFALSAETWDAATSAELFNDAYTVDYTAAYGVQDYQNSVEFGSYGNANVIAVTSVWYTRVGRKIVEFDMLFNTGFAWGDASVNPALMDFQNIATHELGHTVGLADLYTSSCTAVTMYGYSTEGETSKRTLERSDVLGLQKMYGA
ncbi:MAG: matrixin family metalloprotease [Nanoarchaeota archaeon]|nr:matrixin family metalloprotease [Nanoarchaeota archaeon]